MQAVKAGSTIRGRSERWATRPSRDQVAAIARQHDDIRAVPIFREVMADLETPVSAYLKIRDSGPTFLLESIEGGERLARYSFIGSDPIAVLTMRAGLATLESNAGQTTTTEYDDPLVPLVNLVATRRAPSAIFPTKRSARLNHVCRRRPDPASTFQTVPGCSPTRCWYSITWRGQSRPLPMSRWMMTLPSTRPMTEPKPELTT
jgi:hypothetical protein